MIRSHDVRVWVATTPVDMRKSFDSLAEVVRAFLGHDPLCGHLFVFRNRSAERIKILWWDKNGLGGWHVHKIGCHAHAIHHICSLKAAPAWACGCRRLSDGAHPYRGREETVCWHGSLPWS